MALRGALRRGLHEHQRTSLVFIAPLLVTLALKVDSLVSQHDAPDRLALVVGVGALVSLFANPFFGRLGDRTTSRLGRRRPWMLVGLAGGTVGIGIVALAPSILGVLVGWCVAQLFFNALLAAQVAVLPDQVPPHQRGLVSGVLGTCVPIASVAATSLVDLFSGDQVAMFIAPCAVGGFFILLFAARATGSPTWCSPPEGADGPMRQSSLGPRITVHRSP